MKRRRSLIIGLIVAFSFSVASCVDDPAISSQEETLESSLSSSSPSSSKRSSSRTTEQTSIDPITLLNFELNEDGQSYSVTPKGDVIRDITIPSTYNGLPVSSIPDYSFGLCRSMKKITMPDSIVSIGVQAFMGCVSLEEINFSNSLTSFPDRMCFGCRSLTSVNIPSGVATIGENAFERCSSIKEVNFPNTLTSIGKEAFSECISIETLNIPGGVIREKAFYECVSVVSLILGEGVTDIEEWAFFECYRLVELVNKSSLPLTIGGEGYGGVTAYVKHLITNENNMRVTKGLFKDCITYNEQAFLWLVSYYGLLKDKITIPNGIKGINDHCFDSSESGFYDELIDIRIPEGVTIIG
ncbi:MAG: leucine-rich repeat protein, partial [Bacilli bacterium]|nr:leucine-rich repeat protein [Bacilli bacterium]